MQRDLFRKQKRTGGRSVNQYELQIIAFVIQIQQITNLFWCSFYLEIEIMARSIVESLQICKMESQN